MWLIGLLCWQPVKQCSNNLFSKLHLIGHACMLLWAPSIWHTCKLLPRILNSFSLNQIRQIKNQTPLSMSTELQRSNHEVILDGVPRLWLTNVRCSSALFSLHIPCGLTHTLTYFLFLLETNAVPLRDRNKDDACLHCTIIIFSSLIY